MRHTNRKSNNRGFTLVEIMIVVAIIALLAAIEIQNVLRARTTSMESVAINAVLVFVWYVLKISL